MSFYLRESNHKRAHCIILQAAATRAGVNLMYIYVYMYMYMYTAFYLVYQLFQLIDFFRLGISTLV